MATVYSYRVWDMWSERFEYPSTKRTAESLRACNGQIIQGSEEDVPTALVDGEGRYVPQRPVTLTIRRSRRPVSDVAAHAA